MAIENVMRVDNGNIIGGTGGGSKNFQGTIEEWNALTTEEKKAYDHASIPDSLDGNVTFPASKVMLPSGTSLANGVTMTKLWENLNPTQAFAEQSVELSSSDYDFLLCCFNINAVIIPKGGEGNSLYTGIKANIVYNWRRFFKNTDNTHVYFYAGNQYQPSANSSSNDNSTIIPTFIYGIKIG